MTQQLKGAEVVGVIDEYSAKTVAELAANNITPTLAIVRVGEKPDDISYQRGATKRCEKVGVQVRPIELAQDITQQQLMDTIHQLNVDTGVHGVLLLRPLPKHINDDQVCNALSPEKDIDGITNASLAGVFANSGVGYAPCTAQACIEILDHYGIDPQGMNTVVVGRSLVVGKPVTMLLLARHATVTVCHTRTADMPSVCRGAQLLVVSAGRAAMVDKSYLSQGQIVLDVGINVTQDGKLCGDVNAADADGLVKAITPVPGGVGTVTTSVLVRNVVNAAKKAAAQQ